MKRGLELVIGRDGATVYADGGAAGVRIAADAGCGAVLDRLCRRQGIRARVVAVYVAEDLVFHCDLDLPASTPDLRQAVELQLGMLTPFDAADACYAFVRRREGDILRLQVAACDRGRVEAVLASLKEAGFTVRGMYPESQRYLTPRSPSGSWALVFGGHVRRIVVFRERRFSGLLLSDSDLDAGRIKDLAGVEEVVFAGGDTGELLSSPPGLRHFNMLPRQYRSTDFAGIAVRVMAVAAALVVFVAVAGGFYRLRAVSRDLDARIAALAPAVARVRTELGRQAELRDFLTAYADIGVNPDIFGVLVSLTRAMPEHSYLEQLQYDGRGVYLLRGFTADVGGLTAALKKEFGRVKLKSTGRRSGKLFFQIELEGRR